MNILFGIIGGLISFICALLYLNNRARNDLRKAKVDNLVALNKEKDKDTARILANAQLLSKSTGSDYEKAMGNLPADYIPPARNKPPGV